jgi:hypothetical protein
MLEQRQITRRKFSYYMLVFNDETGELVGHWIDISPGGFRLETLKPIPENRDFRFRIDLAGEISSQASLVFGARSRWCDRDPYDPNLYVAGFQVTKLTPDEHKIYARIFERYGSTDSNRNYTGDYLWR